MLCQSFRSNDVLHPSDFAGATNAVWVRCLCEEAFSNFERPADAVQYVCDIPEQGNSIKAARAPKGYTIGKH